MSLPHHRHISLESIAQYERRRKWMIVKAKLAVFSIAAMRFLGIASTYLIVAICSATAAWFIAKQEPREIKLKSIQEPSALYLAPYSCTKQESLEYLRGCNQRNRMEKTK